MPQTISLRKVLNVRENEKNVAHKAYLNSQAIFEKAATRLYHLLKKKESAEMAYDESITSSVPLEWIKEQIEYIEKLNQEINFLQKEVQLARANMEKRQEVLNAAYIEVKKFESLINQRVHEASEEAARREKNFMDEISINQYLNHKNG